MTPGIVFAFLLLTALIFAVFRLAGKNGLFLPGKSKMKPQASSDHMTADYKVKTGGKLVFSLNLRTAREEGRAITAISYHMSPEQKAMYSASEHTEAVHFINRTVSDRHRVTLYHVFVFWKDDAKTEQVESCWKYRPGKRPIQVKMKDAPERPRSPLIGPSNNRIITPTSNG